MTDWTEFAACRGMDPALFYPDDNNPTSGARIRNICAECPCRLPCLEAGMNEVYGFFGGLSPRERRDVRQGRNTGVMSQRRNLAKCGTSAGYKRHHRNGEQACPACRQANTEASTERKRRWRLRGRAS